MSHLPEPILVPAIVNHPVRGRYGTDLVIMASGGDRVRVYIGETEDSSHALWLGVESLAEVAAAVTSCARELLA